MRTIFITGSSGMIGSGFVERILSDSNDNLILLLHKADPAVSPSGRVKILKGDVREKNLGLSDSDIKLLQDNIDIVVHSAAITKFNLPYKNISETNYHGAINTFNVFRNSNLSHGVFLSTVYTSGKLTGRISEELFPADTDYANTYEQTKAEAERAIYKNYDFPISILRFSTVFGSNVDGHVEHPTAPHNAIRLMNLGLCTMVPGDNDYLVNLIPSTYTINTAFKLLENQSLAGNIYNIAAPDDKCFSLDQLLDVSYDLLAKYDEEFRLKRSPRPIIIDQGTYDELMQSLKEAGNDLMYTSASTMRHFALQLNYPKTFNIDNTLKLDSEYSVNFPHISTYFEKVIKYLLESNWCKTST